MFDSILKCVFSRHKTRKRNERKSNYKNTEHCKAFSVIYLKYGRDQIIKHLKHLNLSEYVKQIPPDTSLTSLPLNEFSGIEKGKARKKKKRQENYIQIGSFTSPSWRLVAVSDAHAIARERGFTGAAGNLYLR